MELSGRVAHMAYGVGPGLRLLRGQIGASMRGGLMLLTDMDCDGCHGDVPAFCQEVVRECVTRNFDGLIADFEQPSHRQLEQFIAETAPLLQKKGMTLYTTPRYAHCSNDSRVIIPSALVSGSLRGHIAAAQTRYGGHRLALEIERLARDITLPDARGQGDHIDRERLQALAAERQTFFSQELCTHYFTYKDAQGFTHFVLYDDGQSIMKKVQLAARMGVTEGFLLYPEAVDIWPLLVGKNPALEL